MAGKQAKQSSYSYFKVATCTQAQQGGAMQQPEQAHRWSGALAQPCGSYSSWGLGGPCLVARKMLLEAAVPPSRQPPLQVPQVLAAAWRRA